MKWDIFGNRENPTCSAIEFEGGGKEAFAYHVFFPTEEDKAIMHWRNLNDVSHLIDQICEQVLNREARPIDLLLFGSLLHRGEKSVRDVVKLIGLSPDYRRRFISGRTIDEAIGLCYEHFLSRKADGGGKSYYINKVKKTGFDAIIAELIDSTEYKEEFGEDDVPVKYWLETSIETIRIRLTSPVSMATVHQSPILARGRVEGLPPSGRYFIVGYIITDVEYEQERASINKDGSWVIDHIHLGSTSHRLFFRIIDENKKLIAESKEITIFRR